MYRGPRRAIDLASLERDAEGRILAVRLKGCGHRLVYERRQRELRSPTTCCPDCAGAPPSARLRAPAPSRPAPSPDAAAPPPRRRGVSFVGIAVGPGALDEVELRRADRARLEALRGRQLSQGERDALLAAEGLFRTKCGTVDHQSAIEGLERALRNAGRLGGGG